MQNPRTAKLHLGSCTITILKIEDKNSISTANLGDSGYSLMRLNKETNLVEVLYRKKEGQKQFNFPY
jgi:hypothetical protein